MLKPFAAIALSLASICTIAGAAQIRYLPDAPGTWKPWVFRAYDDNRRRVAARPADIAALEKQLVALGAILKRTPGFAAPVGFSVETAGELDLESFRPGQPAVTSLPLPATFNFGAYNVHEFDRAGKVVRDDTGETSQLLFFVNQLAVPLFYASGFIPEFEDLETDVTRLAKAQPDLFGMPRYGDTLVLKKNPAPVWTAVSLEESLQLAGRGIDGRLTKQREILARLQQHYADLISPAKREKRIAEHKAIAAMAKDPKKTLDELMKAEDRMPAIAAEQKGPIADAEKRVNAVEREQVAVTAALAALAPADRARPACYAAADPVSLSRFRRDGGTACVPLVRPNWKLFNPALPRSAPQIVAIGHFTQCLVPPTPPRAGGCTANRKLLEGLDRDAILAWLQ